MKDNGKGELRTQVVDAQIHRVRMGRISQLQLRVLPKNALRGQ